MDSPLDRVIVAPLEAFVYFLDEIGVDKKHFVIFDAESFPPRICAFFHLLRGQTLDNDQSIIVFRSRAIRDECWLVEPCDRREQKGHFDDGQF